MLDKKIADDVRLVITVITGMNDLSSSDPNKNRLDLYVGVRSLGI
jgi:hypothetical protein